MGHFWHTITASSARTPLPMLGPRARAFSCVQYVRYVYVYYVGMGKGGIGWIKATPVVTQSPKESREQVSRKWCKGTMTCMRNSNNSSSLGLVWSFI